MVSFRDFSFAVYKAPGVEEECLCLQDKYGVAVNMLLFCAYVAVVVKARLTEQDLAELDREMVGFREGIIVPLRACRQALKIGIAMLRPNQVHCAQQLRARVKDVELAAEYLEQDSLVVWLAESGRAAGCASSVVPSANIDLLLARHRGDGEPPYPNNLERAALTFA